MTTILERLCRALAAAAFLLLALQTPVAAQSGLPPGDGAAMARDLFDRGRPDQALEVLRPLARSHPGNTNVRFLLGLSAMETARMPRVAETVRYELLDEAIATLHSILVDRPELVRVRLELARAFFYKGEDTLARGHFQRVLAGDVPDAVKANVQRFLVQIRARRRWTMYAGVALLPDTNIGGGTDEKVVYLDVFGVEVPFDFTPAEEQTTSGVGASLWAGGEYQHPLGERLRLRTGADVARREYPGRRFDSTNVSLHAGPRWLVDQRTEASVLASARRPRPRHPSVKSRQTPRARTGSAAPTSHSRRSSSTRTSPGASTPRSPAGGSTPSTPNPEKRRVTRSAFFAGATLREHETT